MNTLHPPPPPRRAAMLIVLLCLFAFWQPPAVALAQAPDQTPDETPDQTPDQAPDEAPDEAPGGSNPILYLPFVTGPGGELAAPAAQAPLSAARGPEATPIKLLVDADPGLDDALALTWLFSQRQRPLEVLGIVSVAGNTSVYHTTNNAITVLEKLGRRDVPVIMGASAPLAQPLSKTSYFIHGPDGLWFLGLQNPHDLSGVPNDAPAFYCATVAANPGVRLLALGPLTNIARAVQQCPDTMRLAGELVILGGAKFGGNKTPVAEFNFWQDPEAATIVLEARLPITLVLLDAFTQASVTQKDLDKLFGKPTPAVAFLAPALQQYVDVQLANTGRAGFPDAVAAVIALRPDEGARQGALVKLVLEPGLARGQSVVALTTGERVPMLASDAELSALAERAFAYPPDPNFNLRWELGAILTRAADNAQTVVSVSQSLLTRTVLPDLRGR